ASAGRATGQFADEVAWDALTKAYLALDSFDPARPFSCWLSKIVRNAACDRLREDRRHRHASLSDEAATSTPRTPLTYAELLEQAQEFVSQAIGELPPRDRALFLDFYAHDVPAATLAASFCLATQTVRGRLSRAKKRVLASLGGVKLTNAQVRLLLSGCDCEE